MVIIVVTPDRQPDYSKAMMETSSVPVYVREPAGGGSRWEGAVNPLRSGSLTTGYSTYVDTCWKVPG